VYCDLTSDNPGAIITRRVPYTPKATKMLDHTDKSFYRIRGVAYANELRVFNMEYPEIAGACGIETSVPFIDYVIDSLPNGDEVAY
jgi:hypothetical protein